MPLKLGYLLPTRENIMRDEPSGRLLLEAAREAAGLGFDSIWAGDSLLARPRHDPLSLLAAVAGAVPQVEVGTAVLLPALRNPFLLAQQLATLDQVSDGRLIVGAGIAADTPGIRAEFAAAGVPFAGRVGRLMEGFRLCRALWTGEPVDWEGRWQCREAVLAPRPVRPGGPPIWLGAGVRAGIERTARHFDGWFPIGPDPETFARRRALLHETAISAGRDAAALSVAIYLTVAIDEDAARAEAAIDRYLENYYGAPASALRRIQACFGGPSGAVTAFIRDFVTAGAGHVVLRLVGDHAAGLRILSERRGDLGEAPTAG